MILSKKDQELLNDYIQVIKEKEEVLWKGTMGHPIQTAQELGSGQNGCLVIAFGFAFLLLLIGGFLFSFLRL